MIRPNPRLVLTIDDKRHFYDHYPQNDGGTYIVVRFARNIPPYHLNGFPTVVRSNVHKMYLTAKGKLRRPRKNLEKFRAEDNGVINFNGKYVEAYMNYLGEEE